MRLRILLPLLLLLASALTERVGATNEITLLAQSRDPTTGRVNLEETKIDPAKSLIVVIDMWDRHWCESFTGRVSNMVPRLNATLAAARKLGIQVVMAPSAVTSFYKDYPQRAAMLQVPAHAEPPIVAFSPPPAPAGGDICECGPDAPCKPSAVWTRQHPKIAIEASDLIADTDNAAELFNLCGERKIDTIIYVGVASNICVCHRAIGMLNARRHGYRAIFVRDLVEAFTTNGLDPATHKPDPNFTPAKGSHRTEQYLEQHVASSIESNQLLTAAGPAPSDKRPHVVFVIADEEYGSAKTLSAFAEAQLMPELRCTFLNANPSDRNNIPGLDALYDADAVVLSVRRCFLPVVQMDYLERYIRSNKPLIVLRVSVAAFAEGAGFSRSANAQVVWQNFDREVLGCKYDLYDPKARESGSDVWVVPKAQQHPLAAGLNDQPFHTPAWIYRVTPLEVDTQVILEGRWDKDIPAQPVAWTRNREGGRLFYSSLGHPDDFQNPTFTRLLKNAVLWALEHDETSQLSASPASSAASK